MITLILENNNSNLSWGDIELSNIAIMWYTYILYIDYIFIAQIQFDLSLTFFSFIFQI